MVYGALLGVWGPLGCMGPFRLYGALNPLNANLNPICHLLALLGTHHILHVSRIGVKEANSRFSEILGTCLQSRTTNRNKTLQKRAVFDLR
jgi:hypothetical protein